MWDSVSAGSLTPDEFLAIASAAIARANAQGAALADIGLTAEVVRQVRHPARPLGLGANPLALDQARIADALRTAIADQQAEQDVEQAAAAQRNRIAQTARSEPLVTVANATQAGMRHRRAHGWVRELDLNACKVCEGWADGVVRSVDTHMARHLGCGCIQQPVF